LNGGRLVKVVGRKYVQNFPSEEEEIRIRSAGSVAGDLQMWRITSDSTSQLIFLYSARYFVHRSNRKIRRFQPVQDFDIQWNFI